MAFEQLKLSNQLCFRLYTASRLIVQAYDPFLKPLGITYTQYLVLMVLWEKDEQPVMDIGKKLYLGINTISPLIKRMEKLGILARHDSKDDKRKQIVYLTDKGKDMKLQAAGIPDCMINGMESCNLDTGQLIEIIPALDEMITKLGKAENTNI